MMGIGTSTAARWKGTVRSEPACACATATKPGSIIADGIAAGDFAHAAILIARPRGKIMSKGLDQKKDAKKKPAKTLKEKRAEKQAKKKG